MIAGSTELTDAAPVAPPPDRRRGRRSTHESQAIRENPYLPLTALARYSGLGLRTLRQYLHHPTRPLPHYRIGGKILVRRGEYDAWALQWKVSAAAAGRLDHLVADVLKGLQ